MHGAKLQDQSAGKTQKNQLELREVHVQRSPTRRGAVSGEMIRGSKQYRTKYDGRSIPRSRLYVSQESLVANVTSAAECRTKPSLQPMDMSVAPTTALESREEAEVDTDSAECGLVVA